MKDVLIELHIFYGFQDEELKLLENYFTLRSFNNGDEVISRNDVIDELYIVLNGKIVSTIDIPGSIERKHGEFQTGDFFGEVPLFGKRPSFDTYVAVEKTEVISIEEKALASLVENHSETALKLISRLLVGTIQHLRDSSNFLADVVQWGEDASRRVITDELTGVYNRAFLDDALENFFNISQSNNKPLSLLMVDLDNFRIINDHLGMEDGNKILKRLVAIISSVISRHGIIARYGGDEFSILLPEADLKRAGEIAEEIRKGVEQYGQEHYADSPVQVTTSIGISSYPDSASDFATFKDRADGALYRAKSSGRNRVEC